MSRLREDWPSHVGLIVSAAFSGFVVLRLLVFANFSPTTATGILQVGGTANVAIAGLITSIPAAASLAYGWLVANLVLRWSDMVGQDRLVVAGLAGVGLAGYLAFLPLLSVFLPFLVVFSLIAISRLGRGRRAKSPSSNPVESATDWQPSAFAARSLAGLIVTCILLTVAAPPWLPTERLEVDGDAYTGYVIGTRGDQTVVKPRGSRLLTEAPTADLVRTFCEPVKGPWEQTLLQLVGVDLERYPPCPDTDTS